MQNIIIGYFLKVGIGGDRADSLFSPHLFGERGFKTYLLKTLSQGKYGKDLELILIQYYLEGKSLPDNSPHEPRLANYSSKNKDIAIAFSVTRDKFYNVSNIKRRQFIVDTTLQAIDMVKGRLGKRKLDIDFETLRKDVKKAAEEYLKY